MIKTGQIINKGPCPFKNSPYPVHTGNPEETENISSLDMKNAQYHTKKQSDKIRHTTGCSVLCNFVNLIFQLLKGLF